MTLQKLALLLGRAGASTAGARRGLQSVSRGAWQPALEPYYAQLLAAAGVADPDAMVRACAEAHRLLAKENQTPALLAEVRANGWASELDMQPDTPWPELSSEAWRKHEAGGAR